MSFIERFHCEVLLYAGLLSAHCQQYPLSLGTWKVTTVAVTYEGVIEVMTHECTHALMHTHTHTDTYTHNENVFLYTLLTRMHTHQVTHQTASLPNVNHPLLHTDSFKFKINHRLCNFVTMATTKWPTNSCLANRLSI